jgi:hypothetical protein
VTRCRAACGSQPTVRCCCCCSWCHQIGSLGRARLAALFLCSSYGPLFAYGQRCFAMQRLSAVRTTGCCPLTAAPTAGRCQLHCTFHFSARFSCVSAVVTVSCRLRGFLRAVQQLLGRLRACLDSTQRCVDSGVPVMWIACLVA